MEFKTVFLSLTTRCDVYCEKCWRRKVFGTGKDVSSEVLQKFFDSFKDYEGVVNLGSGENTICSHLNEFVDWANASKCRAVILSTGKNLDKLSNECFTSKIKWGITLDGFYNKDIKGLQHGIDLEKVKDNIRLIKSKYKDANMYLNYTLTNTNIESLIPYIRFADELNIKEVYVTPIKAFEGFNEDIIIPQLIDFNDLKTNEILDNAVEFAKSVNIDLTIPRGNKPFTPCYKENRTSPIIDVEGNVYFCYGKENTSIGSIFDEDIWSKFSKIKNGLKCSQNDSPGWCEKCSSKYKSEKGLFYIPYDI